MNNKKQLGISLIELMVTLAISSLLMIGITQLYLENRKNHSFQYNQSNNLDTNRYLQTTLDSIIAKAGYRRAAHGDFEGVFPSLPASADCAAFAGSAIFTALANNNTNGFCARYEPAFDGEYDCQGQRTELTTAENRAFNPVPANKRIILAIRYDPTSGELQCKNLNATAPAYVALVSGIADVRFNFGGGPQDREVTHYRPAHTWNLTNDGKVRSVSYEILIRSREGQRDGESAVFADWLARADAAKRNKLTEEDNRNLYQVANNTPAARNLMP